MNPAPTWCAESFAEYLDGLGDRAIANGLNRDGVPCPSARRPDQNRHRRADGWQGSTVRAILENPRYTGYAVFGRWTKHDTLLDPDDVAAGYVVRFRRSSRERIVRSLEPAHPPIVSVQRFTEAQLLRRSRATGGLAGCARLDRGPRSDSRAYALRGRIRCGCCGRKMQPTPKPGRIYYRCTARTLPPGSPVQAVHPMTVYLPEHEVVGPLNAWIGRLFDDEHRAATVARLATVTGDNARLNRARETLAQTETRFAPASASDRGQRGPRDPRRRPQQGPR